MRELFRKIAISKYDTRDTCMTCKCKRHGLKYRIRKPLKVDMFLCEPCLLGLMINIKEGVKEQMQKALGKEYETENVDGELYRQLLPGVLADDEGTVPKVSIKDDEDRAAGSRPKPKKRKAKKAKSSNKTTKS